MRYSCFLYISFAALLAISACKKKETTTPTNPTNIDTPTNNNTLPGGYSKYYNVEEIYKDGDYIVIRTKDLPDHGSPFYPSGHAKYEAYNGTNPDFSTTINLMGKASDPDIAEQNVTFRIPVNPVKAASPSATPGGAIGIAINGVVIFNQYNGMRALLDDLEINNLDQYNGHPTPAPSAQYHYHTEPLWLTKNKGKNALVGYLLDGYPVYGPEEDGKTITNSMLDACHGHTGKTAEYPDGIYHYHITAEAPWINGDGFYGTPGTVSR